MRAGGEQVTDKVADAVKERLFSAPLRNPPPLTEGSSQQHRPNVSAQGNEASAMNADGWPPTGSRRAQIKRWREALGGGAHGGAHLPRDLSGTARVKSARSYSSWRRPDVATKEYWLARLGRLLPAPSAVAYARRRCWRTSLARFLFWRWLSAEQRSSRDVDDDVPAHAGG